MINTNDGYYWAEGARDLLSGTTTNPTASHYWDKFHQLHDLSPVTSAVSELTALFVKILPFSFETIIFYMPAFLGSLVVIPIILIAKTLDNLPMGFIAALLASIAWSYYNRTMVGYYDTDMLNIVLPMFLLWSIIGAIESNKNIYLLITALDILIYRWWYFQSYSLEFAFLGLLSSYTLFFDRKNIFNYKLLAIMLVAMMYGDMTIRFVAVVVLFYLFRKKEFDRYIYAILVLAAAAFLLSGGLDPIWHKLHAYVFKESVRTMDGGLGLHFFTVMQTVREAGKIPFETFANRISGNTLTFILSLVGYLYLLYKRPIMIFSLPLLGLGFLAYFGGLRFTIYAVPVLAFGIAFLIVEIGRFFKEKRLGSLFMVIATVALLYPNYKHIQSYKVPTVFDATEVKILDLLKKRLQRNDYLITWWDYGYPIRYYADVKTLIDGGKHNGGLNFPVSYILTHSQQEAARMALLDVIYTEKYYKKISDNPKEPLPIESMIVDAGFSDSNEFLKTLATKTVKEQYAGSIYFYLPLRMLDIFPTITLFSNLDLMNAKAGERPLFYVSKNPKDNGRRIILGPRVSLDKRTLQLRLGNKEMPIQRFVKTFYNKKMQLQKTTRLVNLASNLSVIYMANYNIFIVLDEKMYNSLYIQLFVLENYDRRLFEPIVMTPQVKVFKLITKDFYGND